MIPVDRSDGRRAIAALKIAAGVLQAGSMFAIYPEGTRSPDGALHAGHTGVAYLSMATGVPIVPAGIVGTNRVQPPGTRVPRPFRPVTVRFGSPIDPTIYAGSRRHRRRLITNDVMASIQSLSRAATTLTRRRFGPAAIAARRSRCACVFGDPCARSDARGEHARTRGRVVDPVYRREGPL